MKEEHVKRLKELREIALEKGSLMDSTLVLELRFLEHQATIWLARKHGLKLH